MLKEKTIDVLALYGQVGVWDKEAQGSYAQFVSGKESVVSGEFGTTVAVKPDTKVSLKIILTDGKLNIEFPLISESQIKVGKSGLEFGNISAAATEIFSLPEGKYQLKVYADDKSDVHRTQVIITLTAL